MMNRTIKVLNLNQMAYQTVLGIQMKIMSTIKASLASEAAEDQFVGRSVANTLIVCQHFPVYTIGIRTKQYEDSGLESRLRALGAQYVITNRGGLITFHGLGQLVVYPVLYLGDFDPNKSVKRYVRRLESTVIDLCDRFGITATTIDGLPGVWVDRQRKVAAIGIHCSNYVTTHGLAINCNVDLKWFEHIVPCGIPDKKVTSLSQELNRNISIEEVLPHFLQCFATNFNCRLDLD